MFYTLLSGRLCKNGKNKYERLEFEQENDENDLDGCIPSEGANQSPGTSSLPQSLCCALTIGS